MGGDANLKHGAPKSKPSAPQFGRRLGGHREAPAVSGAARALNERARAPRWFSSSSAPLLPSLPPSLPPPSLLRINGAEKMGRRPWRLLRAKLQVTIFFIFLFFLHGTAGSQLRLDKRELDVFVHGVQNVLVNIFSFENVISVEKNCEQQVSVAVQICCAFYGILLVL